MTEYVCKSCGVVFQGKAGSKRKYCSRVCWGISVLGRGNQNSRYKQLDDTFFSEIDSPSKAYLLGWIASDGTIGKNGTISIALHKRDQSIFESFNTVLGCKLPVRVKYPYVDMRSYSIHSKKMSEDIIRLLNLDFSTGSFSKSACVKFPNLMNDNLRWAFLRGYFDGDGSIRSVWMGDGVPHRTPECNITSNSRAMLDSIVDFVPIKPKYQDNYTKINWSGVSAVDFLSMLYADNSYPRLTRKHEAFLNIIHFRRSRKGKWFSVSEDPSFIFKVYKTMEEAVIPRKALPTDSGYDLTIVGFEKLPSGVLLGRTGIKVLLPHGFCFYLVARSSIIKTGYMIANGIGLIDNAYVGEIMVPLIKVNPDLPDLQTPVRIAQLVPQLVYPIQWDEVESQEELSETARGQGGFGHTG